MKTTITGILLTIVMTFQGYFITEEDSQQNDQEFKYSVKGNASEKTLIITDFFADMEIVGTSGSEIVIKAFGYDGIPEKAKGLKPLSSTGEENTGVGLNFNADSDNITLKASHNAANDAKYVISIPKMMKIKIDAKAWRAGDIYIKDLENEVEVNTQIGDLTLENVSGPIIAHSLSSDLNIVFGSLKQVSPSSISSTSGDIDITLPADTKGTFKMNTTSGGVYTDVDFDLGETGNSKRLMGQSATGKLNGGGVEVSLRSISGDIYVRKSK